MRLLILIVLIVALDARANPYLAVAGSGVAAAAGGGITADLWQTFEFDTLNQANLEANDSIATGTWTVTDTGARLSMSTSGQKSFTSQINSTTDSGTRGMAFSAAGVNPAVATYTWGTALGTTPCSFSFWVKTPTTLPVESHFQFFSVNTGDGSLCAVTLYNDGSSVRFFFRGGGSFTACGTAAANTWYRIEISATASGTALCKTYNEAGTLLGSHSDTAGGNGTQTAFHVGAVGGTGTGTGTIYYDNVIADKTDATHPLGP